MASSHRLQPHNIIASTKTTVGGSDVIKAIELIAQPSSFVGLAVAGANTLFS